MPAKILHAMPAWWDSLQHLTDRIEAFVRRGVNEKFYQRTPLLNLSPIWTKDCLLLLYVMTEM